jgi:hypothetical protein
VPFDQCPFWTSVTRRAFGDGTAAAAARFAQLTPRIDRTRYVARNSTPSLARRTSGLAEWGDLVHSLYDAAASVSGSDVLIDSSKDPSYLFALRATGRFEIDTVHLVRDPRGVAYSWTQSRIRPEIHWEQRFMNIRTPRKSAVRWISINAAAAYYRTRDPRAVLVRYEDFCAAPGTVLEDVAGRLETGPAAKGTTGHSLSGNPSRFQPTSRPISTDESWRAGLPTADRRVVSAISAPLRWRYGYR